MIGCTLIRRRYATLNRADLSSSIVTALFRLRAFYKRPLLIFFGVLFSASTCHAAGQQPNVKNVLVLYGGFSTDHQYLDVFESLIRARVPQVTFYVALMESPERDAKKSYQESVMRGERDGNIGQSWMA